MIRKLPTTYFVLTIQLCNKTRKDFKSTNDIIFGIKLWGYNELP